MILDKIITTTRAELVAKKKQLPLNELKTKCATIKDPARDFVGALRKANPVALIAEIKRASPLTGVINTAVDVSVQAGGYERAGTTALSVVTNKPYFQGDDAFLKIIRSVVALPLLRKDFIIDPYQIYESKYLGADAILLIARLFSAVELTDFVLLAHKIGLGCLVETHAEDDMAKALGCGIEVIGINVRDLDTGILDTPKAQALAKSVPADKLLVAESGIATRADVESWRAVGAKAMLVGTTLMQAENIDEKIKELMLWSNI